MEPESHNSTNRPIPIKYSEMQQAVPAQMKQTRRCTRDGRGDKHGVQQNRILFCATSLWEPCLWQVLLKTAQWSEKTIEPCNISGVQFLFKELENLVCSTELHRRSQEDPDLLKYLLTADLSSAPCIATSLLNVGTIGQSYVHAVIQKERKQRTKARGLLYSTWPSSQNLPFCKWTTYS